MKEKHLDINGKNIRIGDIVVVCDFQVHRPTFESFKAHSFLPKNKKDYNEFMEVIDSMIGTEGEVEEFGCVMVRMYRPDWDSFELIPLADNEVEVIGNTR